jgi:hypothetical protein
MMNRGTYLLIAFLALCMQLSAQMRVEKRKHKAPFTLIDAYGQRTVPGARGANPFVQTYFIIRWNSKTLPDSFGFHDAADMDSIAKDLLIPTGAKVNGAHEVKGVGTVTDYRSFPISKVKKGDTLMLIDRPDFRKKNQTLPASGVLYYTLRNQQKGEVPVGHISHHKDIIAP